MRWAKVLNHYRMNFQIILFTSTDSITELRGIFKALILSSIPHCFTRFDSLWALIITKQISDDIQSLSTGRIYRPLGNPPADAHLPFHPSTFELPPHFLPLPSQPFLSPSNAQPPLKLTWTETGNLPTTRFSHPVHGPINEHTLNSPRPPFRPTWPSCTLHKPMVELVTAIIHCSLPSTAPCYV